MGLGAKPRKGGRFSRSPFPRPKCGGCTHEIPYGQAMIRVEISVPNPDQNKMIDSNIFGSRECAIGWLEGVTLP